MSDIDLTSMSKPELVKLQKAVAKAIAGFDERMRQNALAEVEAKAKELGFSLSELTGGKKTKSINPPKYRNPEDPTQTWTGRGRQPEWIKAAKAAGKDLSSMEV